MEGLPPVRAAPRPCRRSPWEARREHDPEPGRTAIGCPAGHPRVAAVVEIRGFGGDAFTRALDALRAGDPVTYRGMTLLLRRADFDVRVPAPATSLTPPRALDLLTRARYRLGVLLASAPPLEAAVGNRVPRLVLVAGPAADAAELYELRGDHLRSLGDG